MSEQAQEGAVKGYACQLDILTPAGGCDAVVMALPHCVCGVAFVLAVMSASTYCLP
jgi:hypothetical protein